jgi:hypothetical protein
MSAALKVYLTIGKQIMLLRRGIYNEPSAVEANEQIFVYGKLLNEVRKLIPPEEYLELEPHKPDLLNERFFTPKLETYFMKCGVPIY